MWNYNWFESSQIVCLGTEKKKKKEICGLMREEIMAENLRFIEGESMVFGCIYSCLMAKSN